jgi:predicted  nucleic acid-binding Zn-ribbon protein
LFEEKSMRQDDLIRELEKAHEALKWAEDHLVAVNKANAALHCNTTVWHSPLTTQVHNARESMERVLADLRAAEEAVA